MPKFSVDMCAKKLIRWKVIKEYSLNIARFFVFTTFIALVLLAFEAAQTPKGQYASSSAGFWSWMIVMSIFSVLLAIGASIVINMRYKTCKRIALSKPTFTKAVVDMLVNSSWKLNSPKHKSVISILGDLGSKHATSYLISELQDKENYQVDIRKESIEAIGKIGDTRAIESIVALLDAKVDVIRIKAAEALDKLAWKPKDSTEEAKYIFAKKGGKPSNKK